MRSLSLRLTHKITAIGVIGLMGIVLVGGIHLYGENAGAGDRSAAESARSGTELNPQIEVELLEGPRAEKDFLLRHDARKADRQIENNKAVAADIDKLHDKVTAIGKPDLARQIEAMQASLKKYQANFIAVVEQKRELGLDEKSGLEGRLRNSVHDIEARVETLHEQSLLITMLTMRRHEKDFMLRRDARYGEDMKKRNAEFLAGVEQAAIPEAAKTELKQKLADYQRDFQAWMGQALKLAAELKPISAALSPVDPVIEAVSKSVTAIRAEAEQSDRSERESIQRLIGIAIVAIAVLVMGAGLFIGRSVSKPLKAMTTAMIELANGNFAVVLPGLGRRDEIGEIAQAVQTF